MQCELGSARLSFPDNLAEKAKPYAGFAVKSWHHPLAATGSSTTLHEAGATNWTQPEHCWPSFGVS
jgi:hypothetical protein